MSFLMLVMLCTDNPVKDVTEVGSEDYTYILDADDPVAEMERRFQNAILQQGNRAISWDDFSLDENPEELRFNVSAIKQIRI